MSKVDDREELQRAFHLHQAGELDEAAHIYRRILKQDPDNVQALHYLGVAEAAGGNFAQAVPLMARSLRTQPANIHFVENYATVLAQAGDFQSALQICRQGLQFNGTSISLLYVSAVALLGLKQLDEAITLFDRIIALEPNHVAAMNERGSALAELQQYDAALASVRKALALQPQYAEAHLNCGNLYGHLRRHDEAIAAYDRALALKPGLADAWLGRGNILMQLKRHDEAVAALDKALAIAPELPYAEGCRLHVKMHLCDWSNFPAECGGLIARATSMTATSPFGLLAIPSSASQQLECARLFNKTRYAASAEPVWRGGRYHHDRIRVGYFSADFRQSAMSHLITGVIEGHDRSKYQVTAFSFGPDTGDEMRLRLMAAFDDFIDIRDRSDHDVAALARKLEIDIAVDLMGFTLDARSGILSRRAAPIQVNYLGYPGTMGADYIDYLIADPVLIPQSAQQNFSEKIIYLPDCYQANDAKRTISAKAFTRAEAGLPENGFVFCCFNNNFKIAPETFGAWMRILRRVDGSVLWLLEDNAAAAANLRKQAATSGVDSARLIFAKRIGPSDHLARHRLADLFLDTLPYNAHTTASDALWAGLPVLTQIGETFAGRVAASLLTAIGLTELITPTSQAYEALAIDLASNSAQLAAVRQRLTDNRLTTPLFDTERFTRHIEAAYAQIYERYHAGLAPDNIDVSR